MSNPKICTFFLKGTCTRGSNCRFLHAFDGAHQPGSESRSGTPKPTIQDCKFFTLGRCTKGDQCAFKHTQKSPCKAASSPRTDESKKFNKKQLILRNLHPDTTEGEVREFIIQLADKSPSTIKFHHDNTAAMAGFQENIEIHSLRNRMLLGKSLQTLHGNKVQLDEVPFCNSILLWNIPADTSKEDIEFEIRRIMGPNSIDNVSYNDGDEFAIVTFKMTDLSNLRSANLDIGERKVSFYFYDENFFTSEIYHIVHGRSKQLKVLVKEEILDYLMQKRRQLLEKTVKTSNVKKERSDQCCFLLIIIENWRSDVEKKIRDTFKLFISKYDSRQIPINPEILGISRDTVRELYISFRSGEQMFDIDVQMKNFDLVVTGQIEDVKESIGRFEKLKSDYVKSEKEKLLSTAQGNHVKWILQMYPMFRKESIIEWLKTDPSLSNEEFPKKIRTTEREYTETDKVPLFQTEAFKNCRHRILRECRVVLATQPDEEVKRKQHGVEFEVIVGDISNVTSDVIVNSASRTIGSGSILAKSLETVAGPIYANECNRRRHETIDEWDYKVTTGGALCCKNVFHAHLGSYNSQRFRGLLLSIFEEAALMSHSSVAIPMLGTGAHHYAKEDVVKDVLWSVQTYRTKSILAFHSLRKVLLVVESNDEESRRAAEIHLPDNFYTRIDSKSVKVTFLGIRHKDLTNAVSILARCLNEQTSNERVSSMVLPSHWDKMPLDIDGKEKPFHLACLSIGSAEYNKVKNKLMLTSSNSIREILMIHRVQNPQLYKSYMIRKQDMDIRNGSHQNERSLFHGTTEEASKAINHHGFNRSYAGKNAASYGDGNYFAVNSNYSVAYARSNARGEKLMYMAKVLVGEYTQGQHGMKAPPKKGTGTDLYDSVVNNVANPSMFIVFPDNHAYPEYLICFR